MTARWLLKISGMSNAGLRHGVLAVLLAMSVGLLALIVASRTAGPSFVELSDGSISAKARIKLDNATDTTKKYFVGLVETPDAVLRAQPSYELAPHEQREVPVFIDVPREAFVAGRRHAYLRIHDTEGFSRIVTVTLLGPDR